MVYMPKAWGYHAILDLGRCKPSLIRCPYNIAAFSKSLISAIDMKAYGAPRIVKFGEADKEGYTLVQLIETSNICGHFAEESNAAFLDVFSCKPFSITVAEAVAREFFQPEVVWKRFLERPVPETVHMK